jgi:hypothetical protein
MDDVTEWYFEHDFSLFYVCPFPDIQIGSEIAYSGLISLENMISNISELTTYRISQHTGSGF